MDPRDRWPEKVCTQTPWKRNRATKSCLVRLIESGLIHGPTCSTQTFSTQAPCRRFVGRWNMLGRCRPTRAVVFYSYSEPAQPLWRPLPRPLVRPKVEATRASVVRYSLHKSSSLKVQAHARKGISVFGFRISEFTAQNFVTASRVAALPHARSVSLGDDFGIS